MMKKFLILILTFIFTSNFFSGVVFAKSDEEKAAKKEAKLDKKRNKKVSKAAAKANFQKVLEWAENGDIQAQIILAYAYRKGLRVKTSYKKSDEIRSKIPKQNKHLLETFIPSEYGKKKVELSRMYGLAAYHAHLKDYDNATDSDAIRWAELGAAENDSLSLAYIGSAYYTGRGVAQNYEMAVDYLKRAGDNFLALQLLSDAYEKGNGVDKNLKKSKLYADYLEFLKHKKKSKKSR